MLIIGCTPEEEEANDSNVSHTSSGGTNSGSSDGSGSSGGTDENVCVAPGTPSTFLPFSTLNYSSERSGEFWYCIKNPYSRITVGLFIEDSYVDNKQNGLRTWINLYDSDMNELSSSHGSSGDAYAKNGFGTDGMGQYSMYYNYDDYAPLPKGKLYVRFKIDNNNGASNHIFHRMVVEGTEKNLPWE